VNLPEDVDEILKKAEREVGRSKIRLSGGWSHRQRSGRAYKGAIFDHDGAKWVVCRGAQRPEYGRLLDATSCFMAVEKAEHAVAILDPSLGKHSKTLPTPEVAGRLRLAAWSGLGILWSTGESDGGGLKLADPFSRGDVDDLLDGLNERLLAAATPEWAAAKNSPAAERHVRPIVDGHLGERGFEPTGATFTAFYRDGRTDGAWARRDGQPRTVALEVKVNEDAEAPFGQVIDDLGSFDAVVHVRLLVKEPTRKKLDEVDGIREAREGLTQRLPVRFIELRFCALCKGPVRYAGSGYPNLICETCDARAVNERGKRPAFESMNDDGDNPIFIGRKKCWRRYRFGGYVTMFDPDNCRSLEACYKRHAPP
jgi:hypothetical protein